jgi:hypothetical protein
VLVLLVIFTPVICKATPVDFHFDDTITGGVYDAIRVYDDATVDMTGGTIQTYLELYNTCTFNAKGGILEDGVDIRLFDTSTINLRNFDTGLGNRIEAVSGAEINIFGYGFNYIGDTLNGYWENHDPFSLYIRDATTKSVITLTEVPEPASCLLLTIGGILLRKIKRQKPC